MRRMRQVIFHLILGIFLVAAQQLQAQQFFPVKLNKKWGLINTAGELVQPAVYDAIGEFKHYGYAVMQRNGLVGLFGPDGRESLPAQYDDIKVLDQHLVAVMENDAWRVINHHGFTVLDEGYQRVQILRPGFLTYKYKGKWGLIKDDGAQIIPARFRLRQRFQGKPNVFVVYDRALLVADYRLACVRYCLGIPPVDDGWYQQGQQVPSRLPSDFQPQNFQKRVKVARRAFRLALKQATDLDGCFQCHWRQEEVQQRQTRLDELVNAAYSLLGGSRC